jgi:site-specific DNA-methyltransferase (adenine-specific)
MVRIECMDNLELMRTLESNSIDLIYSDILYGTGRKFSDYQDLPPKRKIIEEHYIPRIGEMWRVLKPTGTIYLQMDTRINHWIRLIMDDIFGYDMMRNEIIWFYNGAPRKKLDFGKRHDVILRYTKGDEYKFNPPREPYSLTAPRGYEKEKYYHPDGKVVGDVWQINILGQNDKTERVGWNTQKPIALAERIIGASSDPGDIVADFYAGSHTTGEAAVKMGRGYIGCDINTRSLEIGNMRLKKYV